MALAGRLANISEGVPVERGTYLPWSSDSGAEVWLQVDRDGDIVGIAPHFSGPACFNAGLTSPVARPGQTALDGSFHGWASPLDEDPETGCYPFVFDVPDYGCHRDLALPALVPVQVAAFAHEIEVHESVEAFDSAQARGAKMASRSFIPAGLFRPDGEAADPPEAYGVFAGHVVESAKQHNEMSGKSFYWALVESYGANFDVVIDPTLTEAEPRAGGVVFGSFWLSGRPINQTD